jgi:hypothetical protein
MQKKCSTFKFKPTTQRFSCGVRNPKKWGPKGKVIRGVRIWIIQRRSGNFVG